MPRHPGGCPPAGEASPRRPCSRGNVGCVRPVLVATARRTAGRSGRLPERTWRASCRHAAPAAARGRRARPRAQPPPGPVSLHRSGSVEIAARQKPLGASGWAHRTSSRTPRAAPGAGAGSKRLANESLKDILAGCRREAPKLRDIEAAAACRGGCASAAGAAGARSSQIGDRRGCDAAARDGEGAAARGRGRESAAACKGFSARGFRLPRLPVSQRAVPQLNLFAEPARVSMARCVCATQEARSHKARARWQLHQHCQVARQTSASAAARGATITPSGHRLASLPRCCTSAIDLSAPNRDPTAPLPLSTA